jgi:hypothetical protein
MWSDLKSGRTNAASSITDQTMKYQPITKRTLIHITSVKAVAIISNMIKIRPINRSVTNNQVRDQCKWQKNAVT